LHPEASADRLETVPFPLATQLQVLQWQAEKGARLKLMLPMEKDGLAAIHLVAVHRPGGAILRALLDGQPLPTADGAAEIRLRSAYVPRVLNVHLKPVEVKTGSREMVLECLEPGSVGLDYVWMKFE
jgi:hypothetical protein